MEQNLNFYSNLKNYKMLKNLFYILIVIYWPIYSNAIFVSGLYTGQCDRKLGVILHVDSYSLKFLNLNGEIENLSRHQIVQLVNYSTNELPEFEFKLNPNQNLNSYRVYFLQNQIEKILVEGFPINFTDEKIAFLTKSGTEELIDKKNISHLEKLNSFRILNKKNVNKKTEFIHSFTFSHCENLQKEKVNTLLKPTEILSEPLTIKRELDRIQKGFDLVEHYIDEQDFYSTPFVYSNKTQLGIWHSIGSKYGRSLSRANNFTPVLKSEFASDIFDFQRIIITGSAPNPLFEHAEPQTQAYYGFKSSYFHMMFFIDPNLLLVGNKYSWKKEDLDNEEIKFSPTAGFGLGFDSGSWQFGFLVNGSETGLVHNDHFYRDKLTLSKLHLTYKNFINEWEILFGAGNLNNFDESAYDVKLNHLRINYSRIFNNSIKISISYISNIYNLTPLSQYEYSTHYLDLDTQNELNFKSDTIHIENQWLYSKRINIQSYLSVENISGEKDNLNLKLGSSIHLSF